MKKVENKNKVSYLFAVILIATLGISLFLFYSENLKGYFKINTTGNINIFIDGKDDGFSEITKDGKRIKIKEGSHSVILNKEGYWPWAKEIQVTKQQTADIYPFFTPKNSNGFIIPKEDSEYWDISSLFRKKTHIDWEMDKNTPAIIKNFKEEIRSSDFYKDRSDVIIIAIQNGIYALEIESDSIPNFQPIYKGKEPNFVKKDNNLLYIKDGDILMEVIY